MSMVQVFDPYTGGADGGGAPSGGASFYNAPFGAPINLTDGSWTLVDPDNLVQSVSYSGGFNTVTWNTLAVGSDQYNWSSGTDHRAPRWYKALTIDGNAVTTDDIIEGMFFIECDDVLRDFDNGIINGVCTDATSTVATTIAGMGLYANAVVADTNTAMGVWTVNGSATTAVATAYQCLTNVQYGGQHVGSGVFTVMTNTGLRLQNGSRNGVVSLPAATNLQYVVGVGTRANTTTVASGDQQRFKLYHMALKPDLASIL